MIKHCSEKELDFFYKSIMCIETKEECEAFLDDICTIKEITAMAQRLTVAKLLNAGKTFNEIVECTGASTATISRVNRSLNYGKGYKHILKKIK